MDARREVALGRPHEEILVRRWSGSPSVSSSSRRTFGRPGAPSVCPRRWTPAASCSGAGGVPKSMGMSCLSCEKRMFVSGARYRLEFAHGDARSAFFGTDKESNTALALCLATQRGEVTRVLVTTVTFAEKGGKTIGLVMHELYPSEGSSSTPPASWGGVHAMEQTFEQLDELLVTLGASVGRS